MNFEDVIRKRKATRRFSSKIVERDKLNKILEAGRIAPTAKNLQPFKIYVIEGEESLKKLDEITRCRYGAKTVLVVCGDKEKGYQKEDIDMYVVDATIVATHMLLEATNVGVDNIWIELFDNQKLKKAFDIPDNLKPVCLIPIGYKSKLCPPSPFHKIRKKLDDLIEYK